MRTTITVISFALMITCVVAQNRQVDQLERKIEAALEKRYNTERTAEMKRYIVQRFRQDGVFTILSQGSQREDFLQRQITAYIIKYDLSHKFYNDFTSKLHLKFPEHRKEIESYENELRRRKVFEESCNVNCNHNQMRTNSEFYVDHYDCELQKMMKNTNSEFRLEQKCIHQQESFPDNSVSQKVNSPDAFENLSRTGNAAGSDNFNGTADKAQLQEGVRAVNVESSSEKKNSVQTTATSNPDFHYLGETKKPKNYTMHRYEPAARTETTSTVEEQAERERIAKIEAREAEDIFYELLQSRMSEWYSNQEDFTRKLLKFTKTKKMHLQLNANELLRKNNFESYVVPILNSTSYKADVENEIKNRIRQILSQKYKDVSDKSDRVIAKFQVYSAFEADLVFDGRKLEREVQSAITGVRNDIRNAFNRKLEKTLNLWYPDQIKFNKKLIDVAKSENFHLKPEADQISSNKEEFKKFVIPILKTPAYSTLVKTEADERIKSVVSSYDDMADHQTEITEVLWRILDPESKTELLFNNEKLKSNLEAAIKSVKKDVIKKVFEELTSKLSAMFPNSADFNAKYKSFMENRNLELKVLKRFFNDDYILSPYNSDFKAFATINKKLIKETIENQISQALDAIDPARTDRNLELLRINNPTLFEQLTDTKTLQFNVKRAIGPIQICMSDFTSLINAKLAADTKRNSEDLQEIQKYFDSNACVADEICVITKGAVRRPKLELQPYIDAFDKSQDDSYAGNVNIKDEIDETIYDVIENLVKKRKNVDKVAAKCFVDFLRRTNKIDAEYSSELLFNEAKLANKISPFEREYEHTYQRSLKGR